MTRRTMGRRITILCAWIAFMTEVSSYPFDFTARECMDLFPERFAADSIVHGYNAPFSIEPLDSIFIDIGLKVTVSAKSNHLIKGFLLQARSADGSCDSTPVGYFSNVTAGIWKTVDCGSSFMNTATSTNWSTGKKSFELNWVPVNKEKRNIYFVATIFSDRRNFWTGVTSHVIRSAYNTKSENRFKHGTVYSECSFRQKYHTTSGNTGGQTLPINSAVKVSAVLYVGLLSILCSAYLYLLK